MKDGISIKYFNKYVSNSIAGSANQAVFISDDESKINTSRAYYKIYNEGEYNYSFLFSNIMDSTFGISHKNLICDSWTLCSMRVGACRECDSKNMIEPKTMHNVTFGSKPDKIVMPGEFFASDAIKLHFEVDEYICIEISWYGKMIPYHHENLVPVFSLQDEVWIPSNIIPSVNMIGCDRNVLAKIGFLGDSITQGIGTCANSYDHWNAKFSELLGNKYSYWNLGIGCATAADAASDGSWLFKAKQNDIVFVCLGVNDILGGRDAKKILDDILKIITILKSNGIKVILLTIPPFDYDVQKTMVWEAVNHTIIADFVNYVEMVFDDVPILCKNDKERYMCKYGSHPDAVGCFIWANTLYNQFNF